MLEMNITLLLQSTEAKLQNVRTRRDLLVLETELKKGLIKALSLSWETSLQDAIDFFNKNIDSPGLMNEEIKLKQIINLLTAKESIIELFVLANQEAKLSLQDLRDCLLLTQAIPDCENEMLAKKIRLFIALTCNEDKTIIYPSYVREKFKNILVFVNTHLEELDSETRAEKAASPIEVFNTELSDGSETKLSPQLRKKWLEELQQNPISNPSLSFSEWLKLTEEDIKRIYATSKPSKPEKKDFVIYGEKHKGKPVKNSDIDPDFCPLKEEKDVTALFEAILYGNYSAVLTLLKERKVNPNRWTINSQYSDPRFARCWSPLIFALEKEQYLIARLLMAYGAKYDIYYDWNEHIFFRLTEVGLKLVCQQLYLNFKQDSKTEDDNSFQRLSSKLLSCKDKQGGSFFNIIYQSANIDRRMDLSALKKLTTVLLPFLTKKTFFEGGRSSVLAQIVSEEIRFDKSESGEIYPRKPLLSGKDLLSIFNSISRVESENSKALSESRLALEDKVSPIIDSSMDPTSSIIALFDNLLGSQSIPLLTVAFINGDMEKAKVLLLVKGSLLFKRYQGLTSLETAISYMLKEYHHYYLPYIPCVHKDDERGMWALCRLRLITQFVTSDLLQEESFENKLNYWRTVFCNIISALAITRYGNKSLPSEFKKDLEYIFDFDKALSAQLILALSPLIENDNITYPFFWEISFFMKSFFEEPTNSQQPEKLDFLMWCRTLANLKNRDPSIVKEIIPHFFNFMKKLCELNVSAIFSKLNHEDLVSNLSALGTFYEMNFPLALTNPSNKSSYILVDKFIYELQDIATRSKLPSTSSGFSIFNFIFRNGSHDTEGSTILFDIFKCLQDRGLDDNGLVDILSSDRFPQNIGLDKTFNVKGIIHVIKSIKETRDFKPTFTPKASLTDDVIHFNISPTKR